MSREEDYWRKRAERLEGELAMAHMKIGYWRADALGVTKSLAWTAEQERLLEGTLLSAAGKRTA